MLTTRSAGVGRLRPHRPFTALPLLLLLLSNLRHADAAVLSASSTTVAENAGLVTISVSNTVTDDVFLAVTDGDATVAPSATDSGEFGCAVWRVGIPPHHHSRHRLLVPSSLPRPHLSTQAITSSSPRGLPPISSPPATTLCFSRPAASRSALWRTVTVSMC